MDQTVKDKFDWEKSPKYKIRDPIKPLEVSNAFYENY